MVVGDKRVAGVNRDAMLGCIRINTLVVPTIAAASIAAVNHILN